MNPLAKPLLAVALLLGPIAHAEYVRFEGEWRVKPGTANDVTPATRLPVVLLAMTHASKTADAGAEGSAIGEWSVIGEANAGSEAEAVSLLERARLHAKRNEFEKATELIDDLYTITGLDYIDYIFNYYLFHYVQDNYTKLLLQP